MKFKTNPHKPRDEQNCKPTILTNEFSNFDFEFKTQNPIQYSTFISTLTDTLNPMNFMDGTQFFFYTFQNPELQDVRKSKCSHSLRSCNRILNEFNNFIISLKCFIRACITLFSVLCTLYIPAIKIQCCRFDKIYGCKHGVNCEHFIFGENLSNNFDWNDGVCISRLLMSFYRHCVHNVQCTQYFTPSIQWWTTVLLV